MADWQPIETAPQDWSRIMLTDGDWVSVGAVGSYDAEIMSDSECLMAHVYHPVDETIARWRIEWGKGVRVDARKELEDDRPSLWMPLPKPPQTAPQNEV